MASPDGTPYIPPPPLPGGGFAHSAPHSRSGEPSPSQPPPLVPGGWGPATPYTPALHHPAQDPWGADPYEQQPFIPPMPTDMSYFPPPPHGHAGRPSPNIIPGVIPGQNGFSADWIGFPNMDSLSLGSPPALVPSQPHPPPTGGPWGQQPPGGGIPPPPGAHFAGGPPRGVPPPPHQTSRHPANTPFTPHGALPPQARGGFAPSFATPYPAGPAAAPWSPWPQMTPFPGGGGGGWPQMSPGMGMSPGWGQAPVGGGGGRGWPGFGPQPRAPPRGPTRPREIGWDAVDRFASGTSYGPSLEPFVAGLLKVTPTLNPLLGPPTDDESHPYLMWDMLFSTSHCRRSSGDPAGRSWTKGREAPATFPRVTEVRLVSEAFPWTVTVKASRPDSGVTCGDVIDKLEDFFRVQTSKKEIEKLSQKERDRLTQRYYVNRGTSADVPGGRLGQGVRRVDWLLDNTAYGGVVHCRSRRMLADGTALMPCTFELLCRSRLQLEPETSHSDQGSHDGEQRGRSRNHSRTGSQASSRNGRRPTIESVSDSD